MRQFESGATRDGNEGKYDFIGFLSHHVLVRYAQYMHKHRIQSDHTLRSSDNWKKGIPVETYLESKFRHFITTWGIHNQHLVGCNDALAESLCAELFNTMGMLHEILKESNAVQETKGKE